MTAPRRILPGVTYLVTRRCAQRQFLLRPSTRVNEVFLYLLAVAAHRYDVEVHAFCVLSNHYHLIVTDRRAELPAFHQFLDALVARAPNAALGRWEAFWAPNSYSAVTLVSATDVLDKAAYVLANPVAARLVRTARSWPGLWSGPERVAGERYAVSRPKHFFDPNGSLPERITLEITPPPGYSAEEFRAKLHQALEAREAAGAREAGAAGFLGVARVLAQKPTDRPRPGEPRRALNPRIAGRDKWKRIEALGRLADFIRDYRSAWSEWQSGRTDTVFPCGTYLMRVSHGAACAGAG